jgi:hypothetical protein
MRDLAAGRLPMSNGSCVREGCGADRRSIINLFFLGWRFKKAQQSI